MLLLYFKNKVSHNILAGDKAEADKSHWHPGQVLSLVGRVGFFLCITLLRTSKNQGRASNLKFHLSASVKPELFLFKCIILLWYIVCWKYTHFILTVKRNVDTNIEDEVKTKEQAILDLGSLLASTGQAEGRLAFSIMESMTILCWRGNWQIKIMKTD